MSLARIGLPFFLVVTVVTWTPRAFAQLAPPPPMQAGGLAPPPRESGPVPPPPTQPGPTQVALEAAQDQDSGRGLEFVYFNLEGGFQFASLAALSESGQIVPNRDDTSAFGPLFGASAGLRLLFFTVGPRFEYAHMSDWSLWTLNLDAGWHVPLGRVEPHGRIGAGYARLPLAATDLAVTGFDVRLGGGVDYYVTNVFSIGANVDFQLLRLSHSAIVISSPPGFGTTPPPVVESSSLGLTFGASLVLGLHF